MGNAIWARFYNGSGNGADSVFSLCIDAGGSPYITGKSLNSNGDFEFLTIKYNDSGILQWVETYNGSAGGNDEAKSVAVDGSGNVFVLGDAIDTLTGRDYTIIKYDATGNLIWVRTFDAAGLTDRASDMVLDMAGNVIATGFVQVGPGTEDKDIATIKYNSQGVLQWSQTFNGAANKTDRGNAIASDLYGNIYITGVTEGDSLTKSNLISIKYSASGVEQWASIYNGPASDEDIGNAIVTDNNGNAYVCGANFTIPYLFHDFVTIKYHSNGALHG